MQDLVPARAASLRPPTLILVMATVRGKVARIQAPAPSPRLAQALRRRPIISLPSNA